MSESSLKRWADAGQITVTRTAGGHRRIPIAEAVRFIRASGAPVLRPEVLGMRGHGIETGPPDLDGGGEHLFRLLVEGRGNRASWLVNSLYLAGHSVAEIADGPVRTALDRVSQLWQHGESGLYVEHRATDACIQAVCQLRAMFEPEPEGSPVTLCAAPAGDHQILPCLWAATVLASTSMTVVNLGPDTPADALRAAVLDQRPGLVWLNLSSEVVAEAALPSLTPLLDAWADNGPRVAVAREGREVLAHRPRVELVASMAELEAIARELVAANPRPAEEAPADADTDSGPHS